MDLGHEGAGGVGEEEERGYAAREDCCESETRQRLELVGGGWGYG